MLAGLLLGAKGGRRNHLAGRLGRDVRARGRSLPVPPHMALPILLPSWLR